MTGLEAPWRAVLVFGGFWFVFVALVAFAADELRWHLRASSRACLAGNIVHAFDSEGLEQGRIDLAEPFEVSFPAPSGLGSTCRLRQGDARIDFSTRTEGHEALASRLGLSPWPRGGKSS